VSFGGLGADQRIFFWYRLLWGRDRATVSTDSKYSWIFDRIAAEELLGVEGFSGGASGDEIDRMDVGVGSPSNSIVLASKYGHSDDFRLFPEDVSFD
jgi:hypothetical protein